MAAELLRGVVERSPCTPPIPPTAMPATQERGFPIVQHRSLSAFARSRQARLATGDVRQPTVPPPILTAPRAASSPLRGARPPESLDSDQWRRQMSELNTQTVEQMTTEERERAISDIFSSLGDSAAGLLNRTRQAKGRVGAVGKRELWHGSALADDPAVEPGLHDSAAQLQQQPSTMATSHNAPHAPRPLTPTRSSLRSASPRPSSAARKLRFAALKPDDVHVYESQPSSPRRVMGLLGPPGESDPDIPSAPAKVVNHAEISSMPFGTPAGDDDDSAEGIRRRYFPEADASNPALEWLKAPAGDVRETATGSAARFDLNGAVIPVEMMSTLPSHLGLHHHAQGSLAGYTLEDLLLLSRSTVPAQRATMLGVLAKILAKLSKSQFGDQDLGAAPDAFRERALVAGIDALGEPGALGVQAVDVIWEGVVAWDADNIFVEGAWQSDTASDVLSKLPLDALLHYMAQQYGRAALPTLSLTRLLDVLMRLARHSLHVCTIIVSTPSLLSYMTTVFLPPPSTPIADAMQPNPQAINLLRLLALSSRENASSLLQFADGALRQLVTFRTQLDEAPATTHVSLLSETLNFYEALGRYGLYSHVATIASEHFSMLLRFVKAQWRLPTHFAGLSELTASLLSLQATWLVCATDPHQTTPEHDFLWSQVTGWEWGTELLELRGSFAASVVPVREQLWAALWSALGAWLRGLEVNGPRGGAEEKAAVDAAMSAGFGLGAERRVIDECFSTLDGHLRAWDDVSLTRLQVIARAASTLSRAVQLGLAAGPACSICATLVHHENVAFLATDGAGLPIWNDVAASPIPGLHAYLRPLAALLADLAKIAPASPPGDCIAQCAAAMAILSPGDEEYAEALVRRIIDLIHVDEASTFGLQVAPGFWKDVGLTCLMPFLMHDTQPDEAVWLGPWTPSVSSIKGVTTLNLPARRVGTCRTAPADWPFLPLNHLLRSGSSTVFKTLPPGWNASEKDVVLAAFLLAQAVQASIFGSRLANKAALELNRAEAVFACMRVFMLEHDQDSSGTLDEVFRDDAVEAHMQRLLTPFTCAQSRDRDMIAPDADLELVARRYLGTAVPFFQFYSDFVALYDAVSYAHPLFAALLLPPLSMRYARDYRHLLFSDYQQILRSIRTRPDELIVANVTEYLYPVVNEPDVLTGFVRALVSGGVQEFLRALCVHHVACNIWPDLGAIAQKQQIGLLKAVAAQTDFSTMREVVLYTSPRDPAKTSDYVRTARRGWLRALQPPEVELDARLRELLMS